MTLGQSMLAHSVMNVVFVPDETINQGTRKGDGKKKPKSILIRLNLKRATVTNLIEKLE